LTRMFMSLKGEYDLMGATGGATTTSIKSTRALGGDEDRSLAKSSLAGMFGEMGRNGGFDDIRQLCHASRELDHGVHRLAFRSEREQAEYMSSLEEKAISHLKKIRGDLVVITNETTMIISLYSICRKKESLKFQFNKYIGLDWRVDANRTIHMFIDRRVLDFDLEPSVLRAFKKGLHAPSTRENTQKLIAENSFLIKRMIQWMKCTYGKSPDHAMLLASLFANFCSVDRKDNPKLITLEIDFSFDKDRAEVGRAMGRMLRQGTFGIAPQMWGDMADGGEGLLLEGGSGEGPLLAQINVPEESSEELLARISLEGSSD